MQIIKIGYWIKHYPGVPYLLFLWFESTVQLHNNDLVTKKLWSRVWQWLGYQTYCLGLKKEAANERYMKEGGGVRRTIAISVGHRAAPRLSGGRSAVLASISRTLDNWSWPRLGTVLVATYLTLLVTELPRRPLWQLAVHYSIEQHATLIATFIKLACWADKT